ncbi:TPA: DUF2142 domain-containing protein [Streptococcus suis]
MMDNVKKFLGIENNASQNFILLCLGLVFVVSLINIGVRQPMTWLDEPSHYARSIQIANGDLFVLNNGDYSQVGGAISTSQEEFINRGWNREDNPPLKPGWYSSYSDLKYSNLYVFKNSTNAVPYTPFVYLPYIFISFLGNFFKFPVAFEYQLMRLFGFLIFYVLFIFAVKKMPFAKLPMTMLGLIPTVFISWTSVSADGLTITSAFLFTAIIVALFNKLVYSSKSITFQEILELAIASLLVSVSKIPLFILLAILIPFLYLANEQKKLSKNSIKLLLFTIFYSALFFLVWFIFVKDLNTGAYFNRDVDTGKQLSYIFENIPRFISNLTKSLLSYNFLVFQLGYVSTDIDVNSVPKFLTFLFFVGLIISHIFERDNIFKRNNRANEFKVLAWFSRSKTLMILLYVLLVFLILYLQFSEIGSNKIEGVQQRYFIPLYGFIFCFRSPMRIANRKLVSIFSILTLLPLLYYVFLMISSFFR